MEILQNLTLNYVYDISGPSAPPPSPSLGGKRRHISQASISSLLDQCCEELKDQVDKMDIDDSLQQNSVWDTRLPMKRTKKDISVSNIYSNCQQDSRYGPRIRPSSNCG